MEKRTLSYFASDVHLGLNVKDAQARESRFVKFLKDIPVEETEALYLLGDICPEGLCGSFFRHLRPD